MRVGFCPNPSSVACTLSSYPVQPGASTGTPAGGLLVKVYPGLCTGVKFVNELAETIIHEALHVCALDGHIDDGPGFCDADAIAEECMK